jgi:predicted DNA-binding helix-hairpin-helix protein
MTSYCKNDCKFCAMRCGRRIERHRYTSIEFAKIAYKLWKMKKIEGVFLSSSVERDPDVTVSRQVRAIELLRRMGFTDYVHIKIMPGTSRHLITRAVEVSDRIGINLEFPNKSHYEDMKLHLNFVQDIMKRARWIAKDVEKFQKENKCRAGFDSQMIVGASDETDDEIIKVSDKLYHKLKAQRVYYSSFSPVKNTPLEKEDREDPWRQHRLYQASFLLRDYDFHYNDFVFDDNDRLDLKFDPKFVIAQEQELLVDIDNAGFNELIKVPGIGLKTAQKILENRPVKSVEELKSLGVIFKRASSFIELNGIHQSKLTRWIN